MQIIFLSIHVKKLSECKNFSQVCNINIRKDNTLNQTDNLKMFPCECLKSKAPRFTSPGDDYANLSPFA